MQSARYFISSRYLIAILSAIIFSGIGAAQQNDWQRESEARLRAIYERRELQARRFEAQWLPDSSGYIVRERDEETNKSVRVRYDVRTGERTELHASDDVQLRPDKRVSPDGKQRLEFRGKNLNVRNLKTGQQTKLYESAEERDVHIRNSTWSPDGKHVLFVESDETDVRLRPMLAPTDPSYPEVRNRRFARVGEKISTLRIGVVDVEEKKTQWLPIETPAEGFYLGQVEWAGNSNEVLVEKLSRFRDRREFLLVDVNTGDVKQIYSETNDAWAVGSQGKNTGLDWIEDGQAFIVVSEKDGWRHAFLHSRDGKQRCVLTPGDYDIIDRATIDETGGWFYFYASPEDGTQKYLYRTPLDGTGTLERITPEGQRGTHSYEFSRDAKWAFHTRSTLDSPPVTELVELTGHRVVRMLEDNNKLRSESQDWFSQPAEFLQLKISDDVSMDAWLIRPTDFDESKKYPVFVYVYGEPYAQTVLDEWGAAQNHFHRVVADLGYVVVSIDNRGTPAPKGAAWRRSIFGSLGPLSTEDQAAALKELGRVRPFVDLSRVGIWGWSGGGSNTLNAIFRKPDQYHVGIAVVPKPQPHLYNAWFQEIYMRTREVNPDGYKRSAPIGFAEGLKGRLLMITGSGETNTHIQIIEGLVDRLIELGKSFDYMVYPNRDHGLREGKGTLVHVRMLIIRYLVEHLPRGPR